jgi:hypothetical protein
MFPALYDDHRRALARLSAMLVIGAAAVLPMTSQSSSIASAQTATVAGIGELPTVPGPLTFPSFTLKRDPFRVDHIADGAAGTPSVRGTMISGQASEIGVVLPPNLGAGEGTPTVDPPAPAGTVVVRAIVVGDSARALVDVGGAVGVLGVGDAIGDQKIRAITSSGITLSDGTTIPLPGMK